MLAAFVISGLLYFAVSRKIDHWTTMLLLDEPTKCPGPFLNKPGSYRAVSFLFLAAFVGSGLASDLRAWISLGVVAVAWLAAGISGRNSAYKKYREGAADDRQLFSGPEYSDNPEREKMIQWAERRMQKTNQELREEADRAFRRK